MKEAKARRVLRPGVRIMAYKNPDNWGDVVEVCEHYFVVRWSNGLTGCIHYNGMHPQMIQLHPQQPKGVSDV